jgi:small multidrug resistance pump
MGYVFLAGAIGAEVIATMSLRASEGFSKAPYAVVVVAGYIAAFALLALALQRDLPLGIAYGIWAAVGVAAVAILSVPIFGESLSAIQAFGLVLVILGVFALEVGAAH